MTSPQRIIEWTLWLIVLALVTIALVSIRQSVEGVHVALAYILVVLIASARSGRGLGLVVSISAFLSFNFFFVPPYNTFSVTHARDWFVLAAFLVTSLVAAQLLARARSEAALNERANALRKADELKNELLASVSHDLRTPLTTIKALAHDIASEGDERAVTIEEETDHLHRFVGDLLDLSRIAAGALRVSPEINAADDLVGSALQRVSGAARDRIVTGSLDPSEPLLLGHFDFVHALRIVTNLLENAIKYAPAGSTVELLARRAGAALEIVVADRGSGVPDDQRERIFQAFWRPGSTVPDAGGVGLGLSIARGLAEAQGGSIRYEPREGGGSVFILSLPAVDLADLDEGAPKPL